MELKKIQPIYYKAIKYGHCKKYQKENTELTYGIFEQNKTLHNN